MKLIWPELCPRNLEPAWVAPRLKGLFCGPCAAQISSACLVSVGKKMVCRHTSSGNTWKYCRNQLANLGLHFLGGLGAWTDTGMGTTTLDRLRMPGSLLIGERWVCRVRKSKCSRDANNRRHMFCALRAHSDMICVIWHEINIYT